MKAARARSSSAETSTWPSSQASEAPPSDQPPSSSLPLPLSLSRASAATLPSDLCVCGSHPQSVRSINPTVYSVSSVPLKVRVETLRSERKLGGCCPLRQPRPQVSAAR